MNDYQKALIRTAHWMSFFFFIGFIVGILDSNISDETMNNYWYFSVIALIILLPISYLISLSSVREIESGKFKYWQLF